MSLSSFYGEVLIRLQGTMEVSTRETSLSHTEDFNENSNDSQVSGGEPNEYTQTFLPKFNMQFSNCILNSIAHCNALILKSAH